MLNSRINSAKENPAHINLEVKMQFLDRTVMRPFKAAYNEA